MFICRGLTRSGCLSGFPEYTNHSLTAGLVLKPPEWRQLHQWTCVPIHHRHCTRAPWPDRFHAGEPSEFSHQRSPRGLGHPAVGLLPSDRMVIHPFPPERWPWVGGGRTTWVGDHWGQRWPLGHHRDGSCRILLSFPTTLMPFQRTFKEQEYDSPFCF